MSSSVTRSGTRVSLATATASRTRGCADEVRGRRGAQAYAHFHHVDPELHRILSQEGPRIRVERKLTDINRKTRAAMASSGRWRLIPGLASVTLSRDL